MALGLFSGLSEGLFGSPAGASFDPTAYLERMNAIDSQIQALYSALPTSNILGGPAFSQIQSLLAPGAGGTLSTPLMAQYTSGSTMNALNSGANQAGAMSDAAKRNLTGSSIEAQGVQNAQLQGALANSSLLAALYGLQNRNSGQLAGLLSQGAQYDQSANLARANAEASALGGVASGYGSLAGLGMQQNQQANLAAYQNAGNLGNSLLSAGLLYAMMPSAPAAASAPASGLASMPGLDLAGSGYGYGANMGMAGYATPGMF